MNHLPPTATCVLALTFATCCGFGLPGQATAAPDPARQPVVAVVGASASAGFALADFLDSDPARARAKVAALLGREPDDAEYAARTGAVALAEVLGEVRGAPAPEVVDTASKWVFLGAERAVREQLRKAMAAEPDLIVGLDLMFWFGFGTLTAAEAKDPGAARLQRQQRGFALLEGVLADPERRPGLRIVLGDYPDCSGAAEAMLGKDMQPDAATLARLNEGLVAFAAKHAELRVLPLARLQAAMQAGTIRLGDRTLGARELLQFDGLHPTRLGVAVLVHELAQLVEREFPTLRGAVPLDAAARLAASALAVPTDR